MKLNKTVECPKCNNLSKLEYGIIKLYDNHKIAHINFGYSCTNCCLQWTFIKDKHKIYDKLCIWLASIYCGNHSGFKKCCIAWHALFYSSAISAGNSWRAKIAHWYYNQLNHWGYVPCPICFYITNNKVEVKDCSEKSHDKLPKPNKTVSFHFLDLNLIKKE